MAPDSTTTCRFLVRGQVQGVGFRPFVWRLARELGLGGTVRNVPSGVRIEVGGPAAALHAFRARLASDAPPLARLDGIDESSGEWTGEPGFRIEPSRAGADDPGCVAVDTAVCPDCLREIQDPGDRRHGHGLANCTGCGPRYTIVTDLPYDRARTTMAGFSMCDRCAAEYADPADRRFHAQPVCCPDCGPRVRLLAPDGTGLPGDPVKGAAGLLRRGGLLAMKGLGGYHLVADAADEDAVVRLRAAKGRDEKPFAVMVADLADARRRARISRPAAALLASPGAPIVLVARRSDDGLAPSVAPRSHRLGLMLPNTPLQHLLAAAFAGPLVMTSLNRTDDPLIAADDEARRALPGALDAVLAHDRPIARAVDDSVFADAPGGPFPLRRARGFVPAPLALPVAAPAPGLAVGGDLKAAVAVVRDAEAVLGQHLGDLRFAVANQRFVECVADLRSLYRVEPAWVACDLHPDYLSSRFARELAAREGIELALVQHHHAHLAALLAEHGRPGPALGLVADGVGYGDDGAAWGGEVLAGDLVSCRRLGRLRPLRLPGGDAAAVETFRCAISWLQDAGIADHPLMDAHPEVADLLRRDLRCPPSSGLGRLFDAAASLLLGLNENRYEAMSGMALEAAAERAGGGAPGAGVLPLADGDPFELDHRPLLRALLAMLEDGEEPGRAAWFFHDALADGLARAAVRAAEATGGRTVGLTGGVFGNVLLTRLVGARLEAAGLEVLRHRRVPPNDGGLALGQAAVAAARLGAAGREGA